MLFAAAECQRRWKTLRDAFVKARRQKPSGTGGDKGKKEGLWILEAMSFFRDFVTHRRLYFVDVHLLTPQKM